MRTRLVTFEQLQKEYEQKMQSEMKTLKQRLERYEKALNGVVEQSITNNCNWCGDTVKVIAEEALNQTNKGVK